MGQYSFAIGILLYAAAWVKADDGTCLGCHRMIQASLAKQYGHGAMAGGCATCHVDHTTTGSKKPAGGYLVARPPAVCAECHEIGDPKVRQSHRGQPVAKSSCVGCHDPHGSANAHLLREFQHRPFAERHCESCHQPTDRDVVKLKAAAGELCLGCHSKLKSQMNASRQKHTLLVTNADACVDCHHPHASNRRALAKAASPDMCGTCHGEVGKKEFVHEPVKTDCTLCHNPHAGFENNLRAESNGLCLECHSITSKGKLEAEGPLALFGGQVTVAARSFRNLKLLELNNERGHPVSNHPVLRAEDKDGPAVSCVECHNAHGANNSVPMLVTETELAVPLCQRCHK